ncbi:hypothetical protein CGRA01v4_08955 [Colletotrichum graminicola]|nr:hypothetical protein CGRA01v4_08955 [Colletotrichum graminicola]
MSLLEQAKATCFCHRRTVLFCILVSIWMRVFAGLVQGLILIQGFGCGRGRDKNEKRASDRGGREQTRSKLFPCRDAVALRDCEVKKQKSIA